MYRQVFYRAVKVNVDRGEKLMKSLAKIGLGAALAAAAVLFSSPVEATNAQAQADFTAILNAQPRAKVENDRIKLNCINDKLVLAKAVLTIIDAGDTTRVAQLHELRVAADGCAGKKQVGSESDNSFSAPPGASEPEPPGLDWGTTFEPPVNASPSTPSRPRAHRRRCALAPLSQP